MLLCRGADPPRSHDRRTQPPTRAILRARVFLFRAMVDGFTSVVPSGSETRREG